MLDKMRVLDETNISFNVSEGVLEVFDQHDKLVGDDKLPIPLDENMDIERIYATASEYGYDIGDMISKILSEAVMVEKNYDVWLTEENMIFYSPSAGEFVAEPYIGLFGALGQYFQRDYEEDDNTEEPEEELNDESETEEPEEELNDEPETDESEGESYEETPEEDDEELSEIPDSEDEPEADEENTYHLNIPGLDAEDEPVDEEPEESVTPTEEDLPSEDIPVDEEEPFQPEPEPEEEFTYEEVSEVAQPEQEDDKWTEQLREWKESYLITLREQKEQNGVKLSDLRDEVLKIVLRNNLSVFDISESEVLFQLLDSSPHVFDAKVALQSGFYQAYLIEKDGI